MPDRKLTSLVLRLAGSLLLVAATTFAFRSIHANGTTFTLTLLLAVLAIATRWGRLEAIVTSVAGTLCFNYFFTEPVGTFTISDPQNWVALFTFVVTSVVASHLSASAKSRAVEALRRQQEMEKLYELSRYLMLLDNQSPIAGQVSHRIVQVFGVPGLAVFDRAEGKTFRAGPQDVPVSDGKLQDAAVQGRASHDQDTHVSILPLSLGGDAVGSLAMFAGSISDTALQAIGNLAAIATERARAEERASRMVATRHNEEMKATLLDALAHEFKTPLTSIKAAASSILDEDQPAQRELVTIIEEEADRMDDLVNETIRMARIEAGNLRLVKHSHVVADLISAALRQLKILLEDREIRLELPADPIHVFVDADLIELTIRQLVGNALKYSHPDSPISVRARVADGYVTVSVKDMGPGIPEREQSLIFEKFYRIADSSDRVPGTGMGLAIAREIVKAHGGEIRVESTPGQGAEFFFTLSVLEKGAD